MSDEQLKADVERIAALIPFDPDTREAWQRLRARLTPDRERVTSALKRAYMPRFAPEELDLSRWDSWEKLADAAIKAMEGEP